MCKPIIRKKIVNSYWSPFILFSLIIIGAFLLILYVDTKTSLTASIALIALGFAIFQFWVSEINIDKRRLNDIRLSVNNQLLNQSNIILEDCSKLLIDMNPKLSKEAKDKFSHLAIVLPLKFIKINIDIDNYNKLLNTNICKEDLDKIQKEMAPILGELKNGIFRSEDDRADLYSNFHSNINDFAYKLSKELL